MVIASRGKFSLVSEVHRGLHIDLDDLDTSSALIVDFAHQTPFSGILGCDDSTVELAARVAYELGLPHNPPQAARLTCRKDLARTHLSLAGCSVPKHFLLNLEQPLHQQTEKFHLPWVMKPLNMSASRGVIRVNNWQQFILARERIRAIIASSTTVFEQTHVLVEQYIDGIEVAYEGYLHEGELTTLTVFDKPDPLQGPYFEETIYVTPTQLDNAAQGLIKQRVLEVIQAYGLSTGPIHAELRIDKQDAWILEVASRTIGGDCARTLDNGSEFNLEELIISLAIGNPINTVLAKEARGVMMIPIEQGGILKRVEGLSRARSVANVEKVDIIARVGHELIPLPEGNQYPGYIFARASSAEEVTAALRSAYSCLNFVVAPVFKLHNLTDKVD